VKEEEFVRAVDDADFDILIKEKEKLYTFLKFVKDVVDDGEDEVVIRCVCENEETLLPYYIWLVYRVIVEGDYVGLSFKQFYVPREEALESYYTTPLPIEGRSFFSIVVE
jgi:hypothetical protein